MSNSYRPFSPADDTNLLELGSSAPSYQPPSFGGKQDASSFAAAAPALPQGQMNSNGNSARQSTTTSFTPQVDPDLSGPMSAVIPQFLRGATHPYVCFFHLLFKGLAVVTYWLMYMVTKDIVLTFILTTIFLALDFWTVKNVTGRILVGLRWWNQVSDDGTSKWIFESGRKPDGQITALDKNVFWAALYVFPIYWIMAAISNFLSFSPNFVILNIMGIAFAGTNAVGYSKCSRSGQQQVSNWATNQALKVFTSNVMANGVSSSSPNPV